MIKLPLDSNDQYSVLLNEPSATPGMFPAVPPASPVNDSAVIVVLAGPVIGSTIVIGKYVPFFPNGNA